MKYHSFYMRVLCLILIIGAVLGYNFMQKNDTQAQEITELTDRVSALEEQQQEMLTALEDAAKAQEEAKAAAKRGQTLLQRRQQVISQLRTAAMQTYLMLIMYTKTEPTQVKHRDLVEPFRFR